MGIKVRWISLNPLLYINAHSIVDHWYNGTPVPTIHVKYLINDKLGKIQASLSKMLSFMNKQIC